MNRLKRLPELFTLIRLWWANDSMAMFDPQARQHLKTYVVLCEAQVSPKSLKELRDQL